ncbi:hypothetical protein A6770_25330 [Nostoc minutum NIES-26]|uniref:PEP-CTERM protein-sorting domain-containing protein n=1 Tax=Nostoc minutum NIES-26 TaxID=1844469 RepID=A0A367QTY5_9NOSO|nr:hypothetical protein A6770_25330 [Nostoc minutum NIES-26]
MNTFVPVSSGSIFYNFLDFNYNPATKSLFGFFDVGQDNNQTTDYYLFGTIGLNLSLRNPTEGTIDSNNGAINVTGTTPVPEPLTMGGTVIAGSIGWLMKRKQAAQKAKA